MKKIGLIGGMSWESSLEYYRIINEEIRNQLGGFHSCRSVMESVDFAEIERLQNQDNWEALNTLMAEAAVNLEKAGAGVVVLCTNTMHLCSEAITSHINIPFLHIARVTGEKIKTDKVAKVLLLGTKFTMESDLYQNRLAKEFGIETIIPSAQDRATVHQIIYGELVHGIIAGSSRKKYMDIINRGINSGAAGVILGCTEIPLLIGPDDVTIPVYDTTRIHAQAAVAFALENNA